MNISFLKNIKVLFKMTLKDYAFNKRHLFLRQSRNPDMDFAQLRIYCHMLDKAMNNPNFEKGHSQKIFEDAEILNIKLRTIYENDKAFIWTSNILEKFKKAQKTGTPVLDNQQKYLYSSDEIQYLENFLKSRTSCRNFEKTKISKDILEKIVKLGVDAPTGCCRQSSRFYITQDDAKIKSLVKNVSGITNFTNIQCLVAVCVESSYYGLIDKNLQFVDASLSAENFILGARIYGIYGTMCNFFHASMKQINECKNTLKIKESENIVLFIVIGYPILIPEKPTRRNIQTFYKID